MIGFWIFRFCLFSDYIGIRLFTLWFFYIPDRTFECRIVVLDCWTVAMRDVKLFQFVCSSISEISLLIRRNLWSLVYDGRAEKLQWVLHHDVNNHYFGQAFKSILRLQSNTDVSTCTYPGRSGDWKLRWLVGMLYCYDKRNICNIWMKKMFQMQTVSSIVR